VREKPFKESLPFSMFVAKVSREMALFGMALVIGVTGNILASWLLEWISPAAKPLLIGVSLVIFVGAIYMIFFKGLEIVGSK
jgi:hypothetical protein